MADRAVLAGYPRYDRCYLDTYQRVGSMSSSQWQSMIYLLWNIASQMNESVSTTNPKQASTLLISKTVLGRLPTDPVDEICRLMRKSITFPMSLSTHKDVMTWKHFPGLFEGKPSVTGGFPQQKASNTELQLFVAVVNLNSLLNKQLEFETGRPNVKIFDLS